MQYSGTYSANDAWCLLAVTEVPRGLPVALADDKILGSFCDPTSDTSRC